MIIDSSCDGNIQAREERVFLTLEEMLLAYDDPFDAVHQFLQSTVLIFAEKYVRGRV